jgi:MYXO-CTERM domain-containing protein
MNRTTVTHLGAGLLSGLLLSLSPAIAASFERTMTCSNEPGSLFECGDKETPKPVCWSDRDIVYAINIEGSDDIEMDSGAMLSQVLEEAVQGSFSAWTGPTCAHIDITHTGPTTRTDLGFTGSDDVNLVIWREDWPYDADPGAYALTSVTFDPSTGGVSDVDIELNGEYFTWSTKELPGPSEVDVRNTLTHEVGHFIGLNHSAVPDSTMFETAPLGELKKRTLSQDDIDAVCAIYPPKQDEDGCGNCAVNAGKRPSPAGVLLIGLVVGIWRRRQRKRS